MIESYFPFEDKFFYQSMIKLVTRQMPFGPQDAGSIEDTRAAACLFDWYNHAFANLLRGSHIIIGRRGAGKSALVRSYHARNDLDIQLSSQEGQSFIKDYNMNLSEISVKPDVIVDVNTFEEIYNFETRYKKFGVVPPPEVVTPAWEKRIWLLLARELLRVKPNLLSSSITNFLIQTEEMQLDLTGDEFARQLEEVITAKNLKCILIFDSGDDYKSDPYQIRVFEGMCRAASNMVARPRGVDVRLCMPAEIVNELEPHFSNPGKDVFRKQYLHWNSEELFRIAAYRLRIYLKLYSPKHYVNVEKLQFRDRDVLWAFWKRHLPSEISNDLGFKEDTIIYILRHTHLLPRQLIQILNEIWGNTVRNSTESLFSNPVDEQTVKMAVKKAEILNKDSVLATFKSIYSNVQQIFDQVMPMLSRSFDYSYLHQVFHRSGARKLMVSAQYPQPDFWHFRRLMFSSGALGVVTSETDIYIEGKFQFNQLHPVTANDESRICVHPIFSRVYELKPSRDKKVVLPRGSDFRAWRDGDAE